MKNNIKELREKHGISQLELSRFIGVSRQTINSIENGNTIPSLLIAVKLSDFFKLGIREIFFM